MLTLNVEYTIGQNLSHLMFRWQFYRFSNHFCRLLYDRNWRDFFGSQIFRWLFFSAIEFNFFSITFLSELSLCSALENSADPKVARKLQWHKHRNLLNAKNLITRNGRFKPDLFQLTVSSASNAFAVCTRQYLFVFLCGLDQLTRNIFYQVFRHQCWQFWNNWILDEFDTRNAPRQLFNWIYTRRSA